MTINCHLVPAWERVRVRDTLLIFFFIYFSVCSFFFFSFFMFVFVSGIRYMGCCSKNVNTSAMIMMENHGRARQLHVAQSTVTPAAMKKGGATYQTPPLPSCTSSISPCCCLFVWQITRAIMKEVQMMLALFIRLRNVIGARCHGAPTCFLWLIWQETETRNCKSAIKCSINKGRALNTQHCKRHTNRHGRQTDRQTARWHCGADN